MFEDEKFEMLLHQFEPMIYRIVRKLAIYKDEQEFYQIGCIALWEASRRFQKEKGEFKSYVYSYIMGYMKMKLTEERKQQEKAERLKADLLQKQENINDFTELLSHSMIMSLAPFLNENQGKWLKAYCLHGKTPSEIAKDEGVASSTVKAWRRDAIIKLKEHVLKEDLIGE